MRSYLNQLFASDPNKPLLNKSHEGPFFQRFKHPMRMLIVGKSQSGKTTLGVRIGLYMATQVQRIYVISPTYYLQNTWKPLRSIIDPDDVFVRSKNAFKVLHTRLLENNKQPSLLMLDDVSAERELNEGSKGDFNFLVYNAVWLNLSIICMAHSLSTVSVGMRQNCEHLIMFLTTRPKEIEKLSEEFNVTGDKKTMIQMYKMAVIEPLKQGDSHSFLYIYLGSPPAFFKKFETQLQLKFLTDK
jgi:hypothetical protein